MKFVTHMLSQGITTLSSRHGCRPIAPPITQRRRKMLISGNARSAAWVDRIVRRCFGCSFRLIDRRGVQVDSKLDACEFPQRSPDHHHRQSEQCQYDSNQRHRHQNCDGNHCQSGTTDKYSESVNPVASFSPARYPSSVRQVKPETYPCERSEYEKRPRSFREKRNRESNRSSECSGMS